MTERFHLYARAAAGDPQAAAEASRLFLQGLRACFRAGLVVELTQCIGWPSRRARKALDRGLRDYWLCEAARQLFAPSPWLRSVALAEEVETFRGRIWPRWRDLEAPPPVASELRAALWGAFRAGRRLRTPKMPDGVPGTARQLRDILVAAPAEQERPRQLLPAPVLAEPTGLAADGALCVETLRQWRLDPAIRQEFGNVVVFHAYRAAVASGRVRYAE